MVKSKAGNESHKDKRNRKMSVAASSMNHDQLMSGVNYGISPKAKKGYFDLEMFGSSKPIRGTKTVVMKELIGENKKDRIQKLNQINDLIEDKSDSKSSSSNSSFQQAQTCSINDKI